MNYCKSISGIFLFCCSFSVVFAETLAEFSKIEEEMLLNPPGAGGTTSDRVIIYSRVRDKTINQAMDSQFQRIDNMMFVDTIIESKTGVLSYSEEDECD